VQVILITWFLISLLFIPKLPLLFVMLSEIPLGILLFQLAISMAGALEMLRIRKNIRYFPIFLILYLVTFVPYQLLIAIAAVRAIIRQLFGITNWEKTDHFNRNRTKDSIKTGVTTSYE
jgi:hypothetical protein